MVYESDVHLLILSLDDGESVGYWTTLMDTDVSHKTLMALIYCLLERTKQVSRDFMLFVRFLVEPY